MQNLNSYTELKTKKEIYCWENRPFATVWPENAEQNKKDVTRAIKKKKRFRTAFTTNQILALEKIYSSHKYISSAKRAEIANTLKINDRTIKIWFQNRRMKEKRESSDSSSDFSNESVSVESPSVSTPPLFHAIINKPTTEQISHYPDNTYQLPTYCEKKEQHNTNEIQSTYEGRASSCSGTYFYNESTVYPTQYYPHDLSTSNGHGYDQHANEGNNCWSASQYYSQYYSTLD